MFQTTNQIRDFLKLGIPRVMDGWYWFITDKSYWHGSYIINDFPLRKHFVAKSRRLHPLALQPPGSGHPRRSARPVETWGFLRIYAIYICYYTTLEKPNINKYNYTYIYENRKYMILYGYYIYKSYIYIYICYYIIYHVVIFDIVLYYIVLLHIDICYYIHNPPYN